MKESIILSIDGKQTVAKSAAAPPKKTIVSYWGPPCVRCQSPTQVREHEAVTDRHRSQPFYYSRWYCCISVDCPTTVIMPEEFKVYSQDRINADALLKRQERKFGNYPSTVRPNPNVPIGWPSDGNKPPWAE